MKKKILKIVIISFVLFSLFAVFFLLFFPPAYGENFKIEFFVEKGDSLSRILENLQENGLIIWQRPYLSIFSLLNLEKRFCQGRYIFSSSDSPWKIFFRLIKGKTNNYKITIPEGFDLIDIARLFLKKGIIQKEEDFYKIVGFPASFSNDEEILNFWKEKYPFLKDVPSGQSLEGFLYPDTYELSGRDVKEFVFLALSNFQKRVLENKEIEKLLKEKDISLFDLVTLASLLEKEANNFEDRKKIAGILLKRLKMKMPLQVDATLVYILKTSKNFDFSSRQIVLGKKVDSFYNTYRYKGLPPGPICNPSKESILAVLKAENTDFLYYLSDKYGKIYYSKTYREHLQNIKKVYPRNKN